MENTTVIQKLQAKKNKKGFTLVELVIVIAILAILAAIAIPVVVSTITSASVNTMTSDTATVKMIVGAAENEAAANVQTKYVDMATSGNSETTGTILAASPKNETVVSSATTVGSVLLTNSFGGKLQAKINGKWYAMCYKSTASRQNEISLQECNADSESIAAPSGYTLLTYSTTLADIYG